VLTNHLLVVPDGEGVGGTTPPLHCNAHNVHILTFTYKIIIIFLKLWFLDESNKFRYLYRENALVLYHMAEDAFLRSHARIRPFLLVQSRLYIVHLYKKLREIIEGHRTNNFGV
jgi:hypothetical protein